MSGLNVVAGVGGVAAAGMHIAKGLIELAEGIGSTGEEVRLCASDTALFSQMVENLADALKLPTAASRPAQSATEDLVDVCEMILEPFQRFIARLTPLLDKYRENERRLRRIGLRVQWYFRHKSKITFYQQALQQIKPTLTCLLASMNLQEARSTAPQNIFICQMQVENARALIDHQARADRAALLEPTSDLQVDWQLFISSTNLEATLGPVDNEGKENAAFEVKSTNTPGELEEEDLQSLNEDIDNDPSHDTAIAIRIDLLSLQRKVLKLAANVLKSGTTTTTTTTKPSSALPSAQESPIPNDVSVADSSPQQEFSMTEDWPLRPVTAITTAATCALPLTQEPSTKDVATGGSSPQQTPSSPEDWPHSPSRRSSRNIPVTLTDPFGERTALPYEACSTWASMQNTIKDVLSARPGLEEAIAAKSYSIYFNNHALIPVQHWDSLIAPGARVTLRTTHQPPPTLAQHVPNATYIPKGASNGRSPRSSRVNGTAPLRKSRVSVPGDSTGQVDNVVASAFSRKSQVSLAGDPKVWGGQDGMKVPEKTQDQGNERIRIVDSAGGAYDVPFTLCRSFSNFEKILRKKIYPVDKAESKKYYDFFSEYDSRQDGYTLKPHVMSLEDGTRIPPPQWKESIQPGSTVQISFLDQDLTGKYRRQYGAKPKRRSWLLNPR